MQSSPGYAEAQIRVLLRDLADNSHATRTKALTKFKEYIDKVRPEIYDDDVEYLFTGGVGNGKMAAGLLYYAGQASTQHAGQLKRIAGPIIELIRWLISIDMNNPANDQKLEAEGNNIFYDQFTNLPLEQLQKINFSKHILLLHDGSNIRSGNEECALELLSVLVRDHRDQDGAYDPVDEDFLLDHNQECKSKFTAYLLRTNAEELTKTVSAMREKKEKLAARTDQRPRTWKDLMDGGLFKPVPIQEGEGLPLEDVVEEVVGPKPVRDPLGLTTLDLRATQEYLNVSNLGNAQYGDNRGSLRFRKNMPREGRASIANMGSLNVDPAAGADEDASDDERYGSADQQRSVNSILPDDKNFSPQLFLTIVHGNTSFEQLQKGSANLRQQLLQHENKREALVRQNFGLFVHCAQGLEWLKEYRRGVLRSSPQLLNNVSPAQASSKAVNSEAANEQSYAVAAITGAQRGELKLKEAQISLDAAKGEAQSTLAPILERMKRSRMMRSAEAAIKRLSATLEFPHAMRNCLQKGELEECCALYAKVLSINASTSLKIVHRVKES